jgi:hypothetical protein
MSQTNNIGSVVGALKLYMDSSAIVGDALDIMAATARAVGPELSGLDREAMRVVTQVRKLMYLAPLL